MTLDRRREVVESLFLQNIRGRRAVRDSRPTQNGWETRARLPVYPSRDSKGKGMRFQALGFIAAAIIIGSCSGAEGDVCQIDEDCESGLVCCKRSTNVADRGTCQDSCDVIPTEDAGQDASSPDATAMSDATVPDAAADDADVVDASSEDAAQEDAAGQLDSAVSDAGADEDSGPEADASALDSGALDSGMALDASAQDSGP